MGKIRFERTISDLVYLNPFKEFAEDPHQVEVRKDPLLGTTSVFNPFLKDKAKAFFGECNPDLIRKLVEESEKTCIFCGDKPEQNTPKYLPALLPEGRLKTGEAVLFANLFPLGKYHPVISLCRAHFLQLSGFRPEVLFDGIKTAHTFLGSVYAVDATVRHASLNMNYLFPAGASLVHPHLQMLISPLPYTYQERLVSASGQYLRENGSNYFADLCGEEKDRGERYIAKTGGWHWLTPFSPGGSNEVLAMHDTAPDFGLISDSDIMDLSRGISGVLSFYEKLGHLSFNFTLYSVKAGPEETGFRCLLRIINRQNLYENYRNDDYFLQKMLDAELIINPPEEIAARLREYFSPSVPS